MFYGHDPSAVQLESRWCAVRTGKKSRWRAALTAVAMLLTFVVVGPASPAFASEQPCQNGGYYIVSARGLTAALGSDDVHEFRDHTRHLLPNAAWAELGNLDESRRDGESPDDPQREFPASWFPNYGASIEIGAREFIRHLNQRYANGNCATETAILSGYSAGADALGWALEWQGPEGLTPKARHHIGYAALYGDPRYNRRCDRTRWWTRGDSNERCDANGVLGARDPYAPDDFRGRFGSWCSDGDGYCHGSWNWGNHIGIYREYWYQQSASEIAAAARLKRNQLNPTLPPAQGGQNPPSAAPPLPPTDPNHDSQPDLMVIPFVGTGSGKTEVHALNGNGFNSWISNLPTAESGKPARNGYHLFADYNGDRVTDLYEVSMDPNGSTDVHIKAGPNYQASLGDWATPIRGQSAYTAKAALYDHNHDGKADLYMFTPRSGNMVDVHIVSGTSFNQSLGDFATPAGITTMNDYEMLVDDYNHDGTGDIYLVSLRGGGLKADVHVLSGAGGFQTWLGHWTTPFGACDVTHARVLIGDYNHDSQPDLYFAVYNNGSDKMDVHVMNGHGFNGYLGSWETIAGAGSFSRTDLALAA